MAKRYEGQCLGAALMAFLSALGTSEAIVRRILSPHGLQAIDPETWYDLQVARSIYYDIERIVGPRALYNVGTNMIKTAAFPPNVHDPLSALSVLGAAYLLNVRGPDVGGVETRVEGPRMVHMVFSQPFPCHLDRGVAAGCCLRFGALPLVEHAGSDCRDRGDPTCELHVSW